MGGKREFAAMSVTWVCKCGKRTFLHIEWCASCGSGKPRPIAPPPSNVPSILDDLKKD